ncbi:dihydropteroate synthase [Desulfonema ishimotonii]|uniref:Dihydropteroate synthase n=1 Tax=Desulfonema ishimotonii TaxID=45657 RepID=A0A401G3L5_9BACT|nr:dihydropteroate synthase [Desulfonema ishimotonii]GBC63793.1 dihydropteroate synthase [Desulfonema ishimotonii]
MKQYTISWNNHRLGLGEKTCIMGILNVTPDSFSDGGRFSDPDVALARGEKMVEDGAGIIDIGGESTRPFSEAVSEEEETRRVVPIIEKLARRIPVPISVDTNKSGVARRAIEAGAAIINDISAFRMDPDMVGVAAKYQVPVVLMHMKGTPDNMQVAPEYGDLLGDIRGFFEAVIAQAVNGGVKRSNIIIDPGIGFGKTIAHNLCLINRLDAFEALDVPILVGSSRKAFIRNILKGEGPEAPDAMSPIVGTGTQATVAASVLRGAHIVRVHDVAGTRATVNLIDAIRNVPDTP